MTIELTAYTNIHKRSKPTLFMSLKNKLTEVLKRRRNISTFSFFHCVEGVPGVDVGCMSVIRSGCLQKVFIAFCGISQILRCMLIMHQRFFYSLFAMF